jgi:hypothetical protein
MVDLSWGDVIEEKEPVIIKYSPSKMVGYGPLSNITCELYSLECPTNGNPPMYADQGKPILTCIPDE